MLRILVTSANVSSNHLFCCEEVGVVKGVHLLSDEVRSVTFPLKVVEEVQEVVQEIKDEWEDEEVEENGRLKSLKRYAYHVMTMRWRAQEKLRVLRHAMWCAIKCDENGHFRRFLPNTARNGSSRSLNTRLISFLTFWIIRRPSGTLSILSWRRWTLCLPLFVLVRISRHVWFFSCFLW